MKTKARPPSRTFTVHRVERATKPLPTCKPQEAVNSLLDRKVESCCDYTADCIKGVYFHPLIAATHFAFSQHRPLVLSPDMIWVTILQGLAQHVKNHAEQLRSQFVGHQGKLDITISRPDFVKGTPENPWAEAIGDLSHAIRQHLGTTYDRLVADFSTTGPVERTACEVALLDTFQPYFEYRIVAGCGVPEITLEGTTEDWERLRDKVDFLQPYGLDWWLPTVRKISDQFVRASAGDVDLVHWGDIHKREQAYGPDTINGWIVQLIPYLKNGHTGNFTVRNPLLEKPTEQVSTTSLPSGVSLVPFRCQWPTEEVAMEFLGGIVGVTQDIESLALRPKLGWAVRQASALDQLLARLSKHKPAPPLEGPDFDHCLDQIGQEWDFEWPGDLLKFYKTCNGVNLFGQGEHAAFRIRPLTAVEIVENLEKPQPSGFPGFFHQSGPWLRFCDLADGSFVAISLRHDYKKGWRVVRVDEGQVEADELPAIAWSFREFLEKALVSSGRIDLLRPGA